MANSGLWASLPREVQLMILQEVIDGDGSIAQYASVCKDWQAVIEPAIFGRMRLRAREIPVFNYITKDPRRHQMVRKMWLIIDDFKCCCQECESSIPFIKRASEMESDFQLCAEEAIFNLIDMLRTWTPGSDNNRRGLQLDIGFYCSDIARSHFLLYYPPRIEYRPGTPPEGTIDGWYNKPAEFYPTGHKRDGFYRPDISLDFLSLKPYLSVPVVTSLVLRRQTVNQWATQALIWLIRHFPKLEEFYYEPWRPCELFDQRLDDIFRAALFDALVITNRARHQTKMVLFEDFHENIHDDLYTQLALGIRRVDQYGVRNPDPWVSRSLARASLGLVELSVSFMADAGHFFDACKPDWVWEKLSKLTLTTQILSEKSDPARTNEMLSKIATVVMRMPKLEALELWNGRKGLAGVFRYRYQLRGCNPSLATVTWRGTWHLPLESETIQGWKAVADQRFGDHGGHFEVATEMIHRDVGSREEAIRYLGLVNEVAKPVSLWQIREECKYRELAIQSQI